MKVFITGVAGFLGSHLADVLIDEGFEIVGVDNLVGGYLENVNEKVEFYKEDCNNFEKMKELMAGCDIVFHGACTAHDGFSLFSPKYITENTFEITMSVLSAAANCKIKKFIFCSSMARYGTQSVELCTEEMQCNPVTPYGVAKYASEMVVKQICELNGIDYTIIVPHNIIGPRQNYSDPFRNVAAIMINKMLKGEQPIIYGDGMQKRTFSYIDDCIYCIKKIIKNDVANGEIINIGPDEEFISIQYLAEMIAEKIGFELEPIYLKDRPNEIKFANCSANKARKLLGFNTSTTLSEGIDEMIKYIKEKGTKEFVYNYEIEIDNEKTPKSWQNKML